ncbi:MAG: hypothetical protein EHM34_00110 [Nitrosopumilales archaeon]|nr:MAG: hypothetical protein EHM34_00110 [Nitrosopumilales archaeon]
MTRAGTYNNQIKPSIPYIELHGANCDYVADSPDWNTLKWQIVKVLTSDFIDESGSTDEGIKVVTTGIYRIDFELCLDNRQCSGETLVMTRVVKGSGTSPLYDSEEILYSGSCGSTASIVQLNSSITVYLEKDEHVYFQFRTDDASTTIMSEIDVNDVYRNFSRVRISFIPLGGWNNNNCGNIINRGIRR